MRFLRHPVRIRWWIFTYMFLFAMLSYVQRTSITDAAVYIEPQLHLSQFAVSLLAFAFVVTYGLMQVPAGVFGQKYGARYTYFLVGLIGLVATIATPVAPMILGGTALFVMLLASQMVLGISQAPVFPVFAGVCEPWFPPSQWSFANGLQSSGMTLGTAVTPIVMVFLTAHFGWQGAMLWVAVPATALTLLWVWYGRNTPKEHPSVTPEELAEVGGAAVEAPQPMTLGRLGRIASDRNVLLLTASYTSMNYLFYLLSYFPFLYLAQQRHLTVTQSGWLAIVPSIGAAIGSAVGGALSDLAVKRWGVRRGYSIVPLISLPLAGLALILAVHCDSEYAAVAALALAFAGVEVNEGPYWAATMQIARSDTMAATGVLNTGGNIGGLIALPTIGFLSGSGHWDAAIVIGAAFAVVAAVLWLLVDPSRRAVTEAPPAMAR
jgi:ACS family glucarate transporter-like MFS transporter